MITRARCALAVWLLACGVLFPASVRAQSPSPGPSAQAGVLVVQPDRFGLKGEVLRQVAADASPTVLAKFLAEAATRHKRALRTFEGHVREGQRQGVFWQTVIPVTDPMEQRARERGKRTAPPPR